MTDPKKPNNVIQLNAHPNYQLKEVDKKFAKKVVHIGHTTQEVEKNKPHSLAKMTKSDENFLDEIKDIVLDSEEKHLAYINKTLQKKFFNQKRRFPKLRNYIEETIEDRSDCPIKVQLIVLDRPIEDAEETALFKLPYVQDIKDFCDSMNLYLQKKHKLSRTPACFTLTLTEPCIYTDQSISQELVILVNTKTIPETL